MTTRSKEALHQQVCVPRQQQRLVHSPGRHGYPGAQQCNGPSLDAALRSTSPEFPSLLPGALGMMAPPVKAREDHYFVPSVSTRSPLAPPVFPHLPTPAARSLIPHLHPASCALAVLQSAHLLLQAGSSVSFLFVGERPLQQSYLTR